MKIISWNVNGIRAAVTKGFEKFFEEIDADIFCIQETKLQEEQIPIKPTNYYAYWNHALKKGYSGTAIFTKIEPIKVMYGINKELHDNEGRVITLEFNDFYLINIYTPNSKRELERLDYRMEWEEDLKKYIKELDKNKPVVFCGDLNVAHKEIDIKNPKTNHKSAGFTDEEREKMTILLKEGFVDTYRYLNENKADAYTWWSYMRNSRERNIGWRIDYFLISERLKERLNDAFIYENIYGSDHCPIGINIF